MARRKRNVRNPPSAPADLPVDIMPGVHYNNLSVLRNVDLASVPTIRSLMSCLTAEKTPSPVTLPNVKTHIKSFGLPETAVGPAYRIFCAIRDNGEFDLLKRAVVRFTEANEGSDDEVLRAVKELEDLAEEDVLRCPTLHIAAYEVALKKFEEYDKRAPTQVKKKKVKHPPAEEDLKASQKKRKFDSRDEELSKESKTNTPKKNAGFVDLVELEIPKNLKREAREVKEEKTQKVRRPRTRGESARNEDEQLVAMDISAPTRRRRATKREES